MRQSTHPRRARALPAPAHIPVEPLEPRTLLSTLTITGGINTGTGTTAPVDPYAYANLYGAVTLNGQLLFVNNDGPHGAELWRSDGTQPGTALVKDIYPGPFGSGIGYDNPYGSAYPTAPFLFNNAVYFSAVDGRHPASLWRSDGTAAGTYLVATPAPASSAGTLLSPSPPTNFFAANHTLFFTANDELWRSDGTTKGTYSLAELPPQANSSSWNPPPPSVAALGNAVYFRKDVAPDAELWKTDGTVAGTVRVATDALVNDAALYPAGNQLLLFNASNNSLARYTPGAPAPEFVTDLPFPSATAPTYHDFVTTGGRVLFVGSSAARGSTQAAVDQLWVTDRTPAGTRVLLTGNHRRPLGQLYVTGSAVYFGRGADLWKTDGTLAGTTLVKAAALYDTVPLAASDARTTFRGALYYSREGSLWRSDGTAAGTAPVATLPGKDYAQRATALTPLGGQLAFFGADDTRPAELWTYNPDTSRRQLRKVRTLAPQVAYSPRKHRLTVDGTKYADHLTLTADPAARTLTVNWNDLVTTYPLADVRSVRVSGYAGGDTLTLLGPVPGALLAGGDDNDTLTGGDANDVLLGEAGDDLLLGNAGDDDLQGGDDGEYHDLTSGGDTLVGGAGSDRLSGGGGYRDIADYSDRTENLVVSLDGRARDGAPGERDNVLEDVEVVRGGAGDDHIVSTLHPHVVLDYHTFYGNAGNDTLEGGDYYDTLYGGDGDDLLIGGPANHLSADVFDGGAGADTMIGDTGPDVFYARDGEIDQIVGNGGNDSARADRRDRRSSIEKLLKS